MRWLSRPSLSSEVVAQLHKGETVDVLDRKSVTEREKPMDWLRIALPSTAIVARPLAVTVGFIVIGDLALT